MIKNTQLLSNYTIYGNGKNSREWIYVEDHCDALLKVFKNGKKGEFYNIGSNYNFKNLDIVNELINQHLITKQAYNEKLDLEKEIVELVKKNTQTKPRKFDETIDIAIVLGVGAAGVRKLISDWNTKRLAKLQATK